MTVPVATFPVTLMGGAMAMINLVPMKLRSSWGGMMRRLERGSQKMATFALENTSGRPQI